MFLAVETFLFQNERWNSIAKQCKTRIVGSRNNPKNSQWGYSWYRGWLYAIARPAFPGRFMTKRSGKSAMVIQPMNQNRSLKAIICACRATSWAIAAIVLGEWKSSPCEER